MKACGYTKLRDSLHAVHVHKQQKLHSLAPQDPVQSHNMVIEPAQLVLQHPQLQRWYLQVLSGCTRQTSKLYIAPPITHCENSDLRNVACRIQRQQ